MVSPVSSDWTWEAMAPSAVFHVLSTLQRWGGLPASCTVMIVSPGAAGVGAGPGVDAVGNGINRGSPGRGVCGDAVVGDELVLAGTTAVVTGLLTVLPHGEPAV